MNVELEEDRLMYGLMFIIMSFIIIKKEYYCTVVQEDLFGEFSKTVNSSDIFSFEQFWKRVPSGVGKRKSKLLWSKEVGEIPVNVVRAWNCLYSYLKRVRDNRRKGFYQHFRSGERFFREREDYIDYSTTLYSDINVLIEKVDILIEEMRSEDGVNIKLKQYKNPLNIFGDEINENK